MLLHAHIVHLVDVPSHVHEKFYLILCRLDVAHIEDPDLLDALVIGELHLLVKQGWAERAEPKIVVRTPPIGNVVIDAIASLSSCLSLGGEMTDIAIVVVTPHQADVLWHLQARVVDVEHLLIWDEDLWHLSYILVNILFQKLTLVSNSARKHSLLFLHTFGSKHSTVMHATHTDGIEYLLTCDLLHTIFPKAIDLSRIVHVVIISHTTARPFSCWTGGHRLAMTTAHIDAIAGCCLTVARHEEERHRDFMHGRPDGIGTQAQQQFEDLCVGLRSYLSRHVCRLIVLRTPRHQSPILIVDEDATEWHVWFLVNRSTFGDAQFFLLACSCICPPFPRRDTQQARHLQQAIGNTVCI